MKKLKTDGIHLYSLNKKKYNDSKKKMSYYKGYIIHEDALKFYDLYFKYLTPKSAWFMKHFHPKDITKTPVIGKGSCSSVYIWKNDYVVKRTPNDEWVDEKEIQSQTKLYELDKERKVKNIRNRVAIIHFMYIDEKYLYTIYDKYFKFTDEIMKKCNLKKFNEHCNYMLDTQQILKEYGIIHGDLRMDNVMMNINGDPIFIDCCEIYAEQHKFPEQRYYDMMIVYNIMIALKLRGFMERAINKDGKKYCIWPKNWKPPPELKPFFKFKKTEGDTSYIFKIDYNKEYDRGVMLYDMYLSLK